eukprot:7432474-Alexandrium_andersonii.AAC.1
MARDDDCHGATWCGTSVQVSMRAKQHQLRKHVDVPVWPACAATQTQSPRPWNATGPTRGPLPRCFARAARQ